MHRSRKQLVQRNLREGPRDRKAARGGPPRLRSSSSNVQQVARRPRIGERANGPVVGYLASQSATGTKTDTPILTTPQSISVVTKDQIADQGAQNLTEALRYTPGVTLRALALTRSSTRSSCAALTRRAISTACGCRSITERRSPFRRSRLMGLSGSKC